MNKRPGAETNGKGDANGNGNGNGNGKRSYLQVEPVRRAPGRITIRRSSPYLPAFLVVSILALTGVILAIASQDELIPIPQASPVPQAEAFRLAVNQAENAAEVTQSAVSKAEWEAVATWWQEAVDLMKRVPSSSPHYAIAQSRVPDYQRNWSYAQRKASEASDSLVSRALWSKGLRRADVTRIQGKPTQIERYDSLCKETLYFGRSTVELSNGIVVRYDDNDRNLRAIASKSPIITVVGDAAWTLDSPKEEVFKIQGTPSRIIRYDASQKDVLYYGNSLVYLTNDRVAGYDNLDRNLRVTVAPNGTPDASVNAWTIDSPRDDIFKVQGTPTQVALDNTSCTETLQYNNSVVELRNGFVSGYNDTSGNLKVKVN
ncbi:MAG: hypothetical protein KME15_18265 [Drouetiella hepatica Uher 2000/2452]|jgi:hypothetical protein|uniref:Uncharacterized protein n=1 Tax=Drouetiella hepatica Uher 2000/2452 TaxID=904376 RepID=A0A951UNE0_9CYAN|nr:hypothetical protein [Drouetiella hepatica Uher 2000/2452]